MQKEIIPLNELLHNIRHKTDNSQARVASSLERARRLALDEDRDKRRKKQLCQECYYRAPFLAGCMITVSNCRLCGRELQFGSTHTEDFCDLCAEKYHMCQECGSDLDLGNRATL